MHYGNWKKLEYLHPQWRLIDHPWHAQQTCAQNLSNQEPTDHSLHNLDNAGEEADQYQEIYKTAFRATTVPDRVWFGTELRQHIERIITVVRCEDDFKTVTATLTVLQHKLERVGAGVARVPHLINVPIKTNPPSKVGTIIHALPSGGNVEVGTKPSALTKSKQPTKRQLVQQKDSIEVGTNLPPKKSTKKKQKHDNADGKQNDSYIRASIRTNGGLQNGLVVEVEPDENSKIQNHRWYMTITDGRLKNGLSVSNASVLAKFMETNSKTVIEGLGRSFCNMQGGFDSFCCATGSIFPASKYQAGSMARFTSDV
jgi:hypothetical protein